MPIDYLVRLFGDDPAFFPVYETEFVRDESLRGFPSEIVGLATEIGSLVHRIIMTLSDVSPAVLMDRGRYEHFHGPIFL